MKFTGHAKQVWALLYSLTPTEDEITTTTLNRAYAAQYDGSRRTSDRIVRRALSRFVAEGLVVERVEGYNLRWVRRIGAPPVEEPVVKAPVVKPPTMKERELALLERIATALELLAAKLP